MISNKSVRRRTKKHQLHQKSIVFDILVHVFIFSHLYLFKRSFFMYKQGFRQDYKHYSAYRSSHFPTDIRLNDDSTMIKLWPLGVARIGNIMEKTQVICGQSFIFHNVSREFIVNPMWEYVLAKTILYQRLTIPNTQTQAQLIQQFTREVINGIQQGSRLQIAARAVLQNTVRKVIAQHNQAVQQIMGKGVNIFAASRVQKLKFFKLWTIKEAEKYIDKTIEYLQKYRTFSSKQSKLVKNRKIIEEQLAALRAIEPLKISQQYQKYKLFQKIHSQYFLASVQTQRIKGINSYFLRVAKISNQSQPVIQRLSQFVQLRFNSPYSQQYKAQVANFIKDIYTQMQKYQNSTAKAGNRSYYYYLNPESVLIDQLALKPRLHFQPIVMEAFGLQNGAFSFESRLAFQPTPKSPDLFRSLQELDQKIQLILNDPFYGNIQIYQYQKDKLNRQQLQALQKEKVELQNLKAKMAVWRFLLLAYYVQKGQQYGLCKQPLSNKHIENHLKNKLSSKEEELKSNAGVLSQFLGCQNTKFENCAFDWRFEDIGQFLQFNYDDSVIKQHKFNRKHKYCIMRCSFLKQANNVLRSRTMLTKFLNVKKYIVMYLLAVNELNEESKMLMRAEKKKSGQRKLLRKALQKRPRQLKQQLINDAKTSMKHINDYLERGESDVQARYLASGDKYIYRLLKNINDSFIDLCIINDKLNSSQSREEEGFATDRTEYKNDLLRLEQKILQYGNKVKNVIAEYIALQIHQRSIQELTRFNDQPQIREEVTLQIKRFICIIFTILSATEDNCYLYQIAVAPLLLSEGRSQDANFKTKIQAVEEAINLNKLMPRHSEYLRRQPGSQSANEENLTGPR